jgi:hypothetical protein
VRAKYIGLASADFATGLTDVLRSRQPARTKKTPDVSTDLKRSSSQRAQEQDFTAALAAAGTADDLRVTLHALSRKLGAC